MNKIYKVIYSKVRNCYVVVSELAKNNSKGTSRGAVVGSPKRTSLLAAVLAAGVLSLGTFGTALAKGPVATEQGPRSKADGIASIAVGVGDQVVSSTDKNRYQGATSLAIGTLNIVDADASAPFDGVASSVVGQVNYTKNANAAIIMGAGNKVTNSYKDVKLDDKTLQELMQAYTQNNMQKVTEILQKAVPESGGQVMVMGGGNTVDYAQASQVMGVSNTLKGTKDSISKYNLVDGFQNNVNDVQHAYVVGTENKVDNSSNQVIIGDKNEISDRDKEQRDAGITDITIGHGNKLSGISHWDGNTWGSLTVIGNNNESGIHSTYGIVSGIVIGDNQNITGIEQIKESIAIGSLSPEEKAEKDARGSAKYTVGRDSTIIGYHAVNPAGESVVIGNKSQANSMYETVTGPRSIIETANEDSLSGKFASVYGAFNTVKSNGDKSDSTNDDGMGNSINGSLNVTANAQGTMIMGVGNTVEHSQGKGYAVTVQGEGAGTTKDVWGSDVDYGGTYYLAGPGALNISYDDMRNAMHDYMLASGGAVSVLGNSNTADYAIRSQILGTGNTLKGTENSTSAYNTISGFANTGSNIKRTAIVGTGNNLQNGEDNVVIGDYHQLDGGKHNVILGSMASKEQEVTKTTQSAWIKSVAPDGTVEYKVKEQVPVKANTSKIENAVMLGYNTDVTKNGGVAVGSDSVASTAQGVVGYDSKGEDHSSDTTGTWKSTAAAVSVGDSASKLTRQITNVAAGTEDTDAVNVAQLKRASSDAKTKYYSVNETYNGKVPVIDGFESYTNADNKGAKEFAGLASGYMTYAGGIASTVTGSFSRIMNDAAAPGSNDFRGAAALSYGTFNVNDNSKDSKPFSGVANSIIGQANMTTDSNAAIIYGAGNSVTNSYRAIDASKAGAILQNLKDPKELNKALKAAVPTSGAQVMVMGGGNTVDKAYMTQVVGVGNTVTGSDREYAEGTSTQLNYVDGFYNTVENGKNDYVIGSHNTLTGKSVNTNQSNLVLGDNHKLTDRKNNVILGSADSELETKASDVVLLGHNADVKVDGGVALGSESLATVDKGVAGYDPKAEDHSSDTTGTWKSTAAAVSVGNKEKNLTRQITNVAAGSEDTDAVNVAQLKKAVAGAKDGNDTLVSNDNALSLNGKQLSMNIKDTAGNTVSGSVDLSKIAAAVDTNTTYTLDGKDNGDNTTTISLKDNDGKASGTVTVATKDTRNTVEAGENVTLDTKDNADGSHVYKVNVKADGKVEAGDTKLVSGDTVYNETRVQQDGTYVKQSNTAAQNLSALDNQVANNTTNINRLNGRVNDLDSRVNKVGAGAAALAALHPQDFNPDDKWDFAVGYGNYRDANAMAIGAFYRPDENVMFSMGTNFGNGENMINAGVTFKLGPKNHTTSNKYLLSKEVTTLRATVAQQDAQLKQQSNEIKELREMVSKLLEKTK